MRIASLIVGFGPGGAENLVAGLSAEFVRAGHGSTVAAVSDGADIGTDPAGEAEMVGRIRAGGGEARRLSVRRRADPVAGSRALRRLVREARPDILHVHTPVALLHAQWPRPDVPIVYTHHNTRIGRIRRLVPLFDRVVSEYVAIGPALDALLRERVRRPVTLIPNGVPLSAGDEPRPSAERGGLALLAVGSLTAKKDYPNLLAALALARDRLEAAHGAVRLTVAGEGPEQAAVEARVRELGLGDHVRLPGNVASVAPLLADADLFVSGASSEGLPIAMLEAAAAGLPLVATDVGSVGAVVRDGVNGRLVPPSDPAALADALVDAAGDPARLADWSTASRRIARGFSIDECARRHLDLYRRVLG